MNVIQNTVMSGQGAKPDTTPNDLYYLEKKAFVKSPEEQAKYQEMTMRGDKPSKEQQMEKLKEKLYGDDFMSGYGEFEHEKLYNKKTIARVAKIANTPFAMGQPNAVGKTKGAEKPYDASDKIGSYEDCQKKVPVIAHFPDNSTFISKNKEYKKKKYLSNDQFQTPMKT